MGNNQKYVFLQLQMLHPAKRYFIDSMRIGTLNCVIGYLIYTFHEYNVFKA